MNCKQGDLAMIVRGTAFAKYWGQVVECVSLRMVLGEVPAWAIDRSLDGGKYWIILPDSCLKPLRESDGEDEMLRIAGRPEKLSA